MATTAEFIEFVCAQVAGIGALRYRKMFGEYMVYVEEKPVLLVCDNTVFVKMLPCLNDLMSEATKGYPYAGAKEHYILDIENSDLAKDAIRALLPVTPVPKQKRKNK